MEKKVMPWDKIDRSKEDWEIGVKFLKERAQKRFELIPVKDLVDRLPEPDATDFWEKTNPGFGGLWCAFYYACVAGASIPNSVVVYHGPQHCATAARMFFVPYVNNLYWGTPFRFIISSDMSERDTILGAPEKLRKAILDANRDYKPELIIVAMACAPGVTGEPVEDILEEIRPQIDAKLVFINSPGLITPDEGTMIQICTRDVWIKLMKEPKRKEKDTLNIVGEYREVWTERWGVSGNFPSTYDEAHRIISALGLKIKAILPTAPVSEIEVAPEAEFNAVICPAWGFPICHDMRRRFGIPYSMHAMPIGIENCTRWVMAIANHFGKQDQAKAFLDQEIARIKPVWEEARRLVKGKVAFVDSAVSHTSINRQLAYAALLQELGVEDIIYFNVAMSEIVGKREMAGYFVNLDIGGKRLNPKYLFWPDPYNIKLSPVEVMEALGLKPQDVVYVYGDFCWYAKAPHIDASNMAQVNTGIHWRRHRNVSTRSIFFTGTYGLLKDIIRAVKGSRSCRGGRYTLFARVMGDWTVPKSFKPEEEGI
jgi:nitrogenase molybdenum-iron protein alpha/beta subunit